MELKASNPGFNIEFVGVNSHDQAPWNHLAIAGRTLPWLQDTTTNSAWSSWKVTYRDLKILDTRNRLHATYNLTEHDLSFPSNREALKELLLEAAFVLDTDRDGMPDEWEFLHFGTLAQKPEQDPDGDGKNNFAELAFGTKPYGANSSNSFQTRIAQRGTNMMLELTFNVLAGSFMNYQVEASWEAFPWSSNGPIVTIVEPFKNLYDGAGLGQRTCAIPLDLSRGFMRVRAAPR